MNKILALLFVFNFYALRANGDQEIFLQANSLCKSGDFKKASILYQSIPNKSGAVWYNLGNSFFHQKDYVRALWAWRVAQKLGGIYEYDCSEQAIRVAQKKLEIEDSIAPVSRFSRILSPFWQQMLILFLIWFVMFALIVSNGKIVKRYLLTTLFLLELLAFGVATVHNREANTEFAVVRSGLPVLVLAGPKSDYHEIGVVQPGQSLEILRTSGKWCLVKRQQLEGWVSKVNLITI